MGSNWSISIDIVHVYVQNYQRWQDKRMKGKNKKSLYICYDKYQYVHENICIKTIVFFNITDFLKILYNKILTIMEGKHFINIF